MGVVPDKFEDGSAAFFTNRVPAWHTLGTVTQNALTAEEALRVAYLDTPVTKQPCFAYVNGEYVEFEGKWVTGAPHPKNPNEWRPFGVVGNNYEVIQNAEQFEVLDAIRDESDAAYETAGSMYGGKVVFITMKLPEALAFNEGADEVEMFLLATNSHDGSRAFTLAVTPVRVVCQNTLTAALHAAKRKFSIKHTASARSRIAEAREALGLTFAYVEAFEDEVNKLLDQHVTDAQFEKLAQQFIGSTKFDAEGKTLARATNTLDTLMNLWNAPTQQVAGKNKWGAYNAFAEYVDWFHGVRRTRGADADEARALRTMSNTAEQMKQRGLLLLTR